MPEGSLFARLRCLCDEGVEFILVDTVAAVLHGAPIVTCDLEVVCSREPANTDRLLRALKSLDASFPLRPDRSHLEAGGHLNLITPFGPLDVLGTIGQGLGYSDLLPQSTEMDIGGGLRIRVLNLETIIAIKEQLASEKDLAALPLLRRTLIEARRAR
jgi:hypothetical protein